MTTNDELRDLIAKGEKATARPWVVDWDWHIDEFSDIKAYAETPVITGTTLHEVEPQVNADRLYMEAAANLAPEIARELIEARAAKRWIPVSERLPDNDQIVLYYDDPAEEVWFGRWTAFGFFPFDDLTYIKRVTHWMPLPEPPNEGKDV